MAAGTGLPPLLALGAATAALLLLALLAAALATLVRLVLWLSLSRALLAVALGALYWLLTARRRRYAKGFYSCSQVPCPAFAQTVESEASGGNSHTRFARQAVDDSDDVFDLSNTGVASMEVPVATDVTVEASVVTANDHLTPPLTPSTEDGAAAADTTTQHTAAASTLVRRRSMRLPSPLSVKLLADSASMSLSATESEDDDDPTLPRLSTSSANSPARVAPVAPVPPTATTAAARKIRPRSSSSSSGFSVANRKRLTSSPARPPTSYTPSSTSSPPPKSSSAIPSSMRSRGRAATVTSAPPGSVGAPAHLKRNAFARRSAASERELMQEKMAADGYWIGDFRPERVSRRSFTHGHSGSSSAQSSPRATA